jgi:putative ABC transport system permease protein
MRRCLRPSLRALGAHRLRAALALGCVAVGVAAVVVTGAVGSGATRELERSIESVGIDLLVVRPAPVRRLAARREVQGMATSLVVADAEAIAELALVAAVAPAVERNLRVKAEGGSQVTKVLGTAPAFPRVRRFEIASGRFLDDDDERSARRVVVLGARVEEMLFPGRDPLGRELRIAGVPFEVVGTLEPKGALAAGTDEDSQVVVPLRTALRRVFNVDWLTNVFVAVRDPRSIGRAEAEIQALLRARHRLDRHDRPDDFAVQNQARFLVARKEMLDTLTFAATGLAGAALAVGGTGILGLMLLSVKERTAEIGLRMAVGARPRDVLVQFLAEAAVLALGGWVAGVAAGAAIAAAVALGSGWTVAPPVAAGLASLATAVLVGVGFGALPARRAALLAPIRALASR